MLSDVLSVPAPDPVFWRKSVSASIMRNLPLSARKSPRLLVSASSSNLDLYCNRKKGRWVYPICLFHLHRTPLRRAPLRFTRADTPLRSGQPSPLRRVRLSPPGLPPRRGPHRAAIAASAPAFPHRGCRPAGGPIGQPSPLRCARLSPPGLPPRRGRHRAALAASVRPPFPTGAATPPGAPSGSPCRFGAPPFRCIFTRRGLSFPRICCYNKD